MSVEMLATKHNFSHFCGLAISIVSLDFFSRTSGWHFTTTKGTFPSTFKDLAGTFLRNCFFIIITTAARAAGPICFRSLKMPCLHTRDTSFQQQRRETSAKAGMDKAYFSKSIVFSCLSLLPRGGKRFSLGLAVRFITLSALVAVF